MSTGGFVCRSERRLETRGRIVRTDAGAFPDPEGAFAATGSGLWALDDVSLPATVAEAAREAGVLDLDDPDSIERIGTLDDFDFWFELDFATSESERAAGTSLRFDGLATIVDVWLNGKPILRSESMFEAHEVDVSAQVGPENRLVLCHRALDPASVAAHPRARWRTKLARDRHLRSFRTTLFGRMPSWCPPIAPVGPWRPIHVISYPSSVVALESVCVDARLEGGDGLVHFEARVHEPAAIAGSAHEAAGTGHEIAGSAHEAAYSFEVEGESFALDVVSREAEFVSLEGSARIGDVEMWQPHTHLREGERPRRYALRLVRTDEKGREGIELDPIGFRTIERVPSSRFGLRVNGQNVFCRGTVWSPLDALSLRADEQTMRAALEQCRDAGANMVRVPGTTVYEEDAFYRLCDELGLLVWQDLMFATFDYPTADAAFADQVTREVEAFLDRTRARACLGVLCGGSEREQQRAMLGLEREYGASGFFDETLPALCEARRADVVFWPSTPSGGPMPFHPETGTSHYFGVGAYRRPLSDVRTTRPAFATECLAFANVGGVRGADHDLASRVPRDVDADWDFLDVTRFYAEQLHPGRLGERSRTQGVSASEAAVLRATSVEVMESTQRAMRDPSLDCGGALVLTHRDPWSAAGWGVIDSAGKPKAPWYGLARAWAPLCVSIIDDGFSGLRVRIDNDRPDRFEGTLELALMQMDGRVVDRATRSIGVDPRQTANHCVDELLGNFVDSSYAYRFGPRAFDVAVARLVSGEESTTVGRDGFFAFSEALAEGARLDAGLSASLLAPPPSSSSSSPADHVLSISARRVARLVGIDSPGWQVSDNFFPLAPGFDRRIALDPIAPDAAKAVTIFTLDGGSCVTIEPSVDVRGGA